MWQEAVVPVVLLAVLLAVLVLAVRGGGQSEAARQAAFDEAAAALAAKKTDVTEGRDRFLRLEGAGWQLEIHTLLPGGDGLSHRRGSSEHVRLRHAVEPPLPGLVLITERAKGAPVEVVAGLVSHVLEDLMGRAPAASVQGLEQVRLGGEAPAFAHPAAAARFDATCIERLGALRELVPLELLADPEGLVAVLARAPRSAQELARWVEATRQLASALGATAR